jgi:RNA polymerase sigma-70 factor (ECF subfamily)
VEETATADGGFDPVRAGRFQPKRPAEFLAELFDAHAPMVLGLCRALLRNAHDAEDAAQQTFLSAYASLLAGTRPRDAGAWLSTIARNECRTRAHRRMREPLPVAETETVAPATPAVAADMEALRVALAGLPGQQRQAFVLREFSGLSYDELAAALDVSVPAVESLLFRARRQLRASLRSAAAAAFSFPAAARELLVQVLGGPGDGSNAAGLAKLGSLPVLAKLASVGAGAAVLTAGVVAVAPSGGHRSARRHRSAAPTAIAARAASTAPARMSATTLVEHDSGSAARAGRSDGSGQPTSREAGRSHGGDVVHESAPARAPVGVEGDQPGADGADTSHQQPRVQEPSDSEGGGSAERSSSSDGGSGGLDSGSGGESGSGAGSSSDGGSASDGSASDG